MYTFTIQRALSITNPTGSTLNGTIMSGPNNYCALSCWPRTRPAPSYPFPRGPSGIRSTWPRVQKKSLKACNIKPGRWLGGRGSFPNYSVPQMLCWVPPPVSLVPRTSALDRQVYFPAWYAIQFLRRTEANETKSTVSHYGPIHCFHSILSTTSGQVLVLTFLPSPAPSPGLECNSFPSTPTLKHFHG